MHGFMASTEQTQLRQAQENKALQAQNAQYRDNSQRLQQQLQKLQQELQQARQENSNLQAKDAQLTSNYQKLSGASKQLAQQYKQLQAQDGQLKVKDQQEAGEIKDLQKEKSGLLGTLRKFKGIIAAQGQQLDAAISDAATNAASPPQVDISPEPAEASVPSLPDPAPLPVAQAPVAPVAQPATMEPLPALPEAPPLATAPVVSNSAPVTLSTADQVPDMPDMGPLELGPPPAPSTPSKDSKAFKQKGKKSAAQQSSLEKDLSSLSDVRKVDDIPTPGMDPDVSKIAQADDQVLQMARDAGFLPSA